ncbi:CHY zinc finger protein [Micromonospora avicenniae]|uniref:CHY zinc finger protein n=1 Tax=Micromonospora avicenniae TaxID=1198245 RepID=UPI00332D6836
MQIHGKTVDDQTRCVHYATPVDVVAIKFACCLRYYPCHLCHEETTNHSASQWPVDQRGQHAVFCGVCRTELTVEEYLAVDSCPNCHAAFNERCRLHTHLYFQVR